MASPASRLLALLERLQARPVITGPGLAGELGVDIRTLRRYVAALQELGIPVEGQRGVGGGYRMRPGFRLPPLMFGDDEAVVLVLGLTAARQLGLDTEDAAADRALAKIHRVLPTRLRGRVEALESALDFTPTGAGAEPVAGETALLLADAIGRRRRVRARYRSFSGAVSDRELSPHGLVVHEGRWYLAAHDHGRGELRTFRVDRLTRTAASEDAAVPPAPDFDAVAYVTSSLASIPFAWDVEVALDLPLEQAADRIPPTLGGLTEEGSLSVLRMRVDSLDWMASVLAGLGCRFTIRRPDELAASVRALAARLEESAVYPDP
jgi:predicted DNA-binding transcriptional regulator YafY